MRRIPITYKSLPIAKRCPRCHGALEALTRSDGSVYSIHCPNRFLCRYTLRLVVSKPKGSVRMAKGSDKPLISLVVPPGDEKSTKGDPDHI